MVTSGNTMIAEVVDILDETKSCNNLPALPVNTKWATGGSVQGKPIVCGGVGFDAGNSVYTKECYAFENGNWTLLTNLIQPRANAGSTVINGDHLWITGGQTPSMYILLYKVCFES